MNIQKILVSQPYPSSDKSPYFDIQKKFGVELTFKPFIRIESVTAAEFRTQKVSIPSFTAIVLTSRTAVDNFFKLMGELKMKLNEELQYFCLTEAIAHYLQHFIVFRKRKVHYSKTGKIEDLAQVMKKHNTEKYLIPVAENHKSEDIAVFTKAKIKQFATAVMYRTVNTEFTPEEIASFDMMLFFTPAGIQSLYDNAPGYQQSEQRIGVFGPTTTKVAEEHGLRIDAQGPTPECLSMAAVLQKYLQENKKD